MRFFWILSFLSYCVLCIFFVSKKKKEKQKTTRKIEKKRETWIIDIKRKKKSRRRKERKKERKHHWKKDSCKWWSFMDGVCKSSKQSLPSLLDCLVGWLFVWLIGWKRFHPKIKIKWIEKKGGEILKIFDILIFWYLGVNELYVMDLNDWLIFEIIINGGEEGWKIEGRRFEPNGIFFFIIKNFILFYELFYELFCNCQFLISFHIKFRK